jgi:metal-responsive CopG/Arc/MetJ family transcriptional regulator
MRTLVDIPEEDLKALDDLGERRRASRAKMIRQAVREFLVNNRRASADEAFGLWRDQGVDGLEFQERLRAEW